MPCFAIYVSEIGLPYRCCRVSEVLETNVDWKNATYSRADNSSRAREYITTSLNAHAYRHQPLRYGCTVADGPTVSGQVLSVSDNATYRELPQSCALA